MATVSSTLKIFDSMTGPIKNITQSMNIMISTMRQMQNATNQNVNVDRTLIAAQQRIAQAEIEINRQINQSKQTQDKFNRSVRDAESAIHSAGFAVIALNQGLELVRKGWDAIQSVMRMSDELTATNARLSLVNDGLRSQEKFQQQVLDVANKTRASYTATADLITKIGAGTQGVFKNDDQMLRFAEQFNKTLVLSGTSAWEAENAILQMSQALGSGVLQGDELRSLSEAAPALMRILADGLGVARGQLKQMGADGKLTADKIVKAFENQSQQIDKMFNQMPITFGQSMTILKNTFRNWFSTLGQANGPLQKITEQVLHLTAFMQSDAGQRFFTGLANAVAIAVSWLVQLAEWAERIYSFFSGNWSTIGPIIMGIAATIGALIIAIKGAAIAQGILNAVMNANPFVLIATLIVGLIVYLVRLWRTNDQFAAGLMRAWNEILNFFDQVPIFFQKVGNGIIDNFEWMKVQSLKAFDNLANGIINSINWILKQSNQFLGTSFEMIGHVEFSAKAAAEAEAIKQAGAERVAKMQMNAEQKAAAREQKVIDFLDSRATKRAEQEAKQQSQSKVFSGTSLFSPTGAPNINKVNEVGKIRDKVDISSEDLQMLRELAEMKNIQNFVTLQPQLTFGDTHVRQDGRSVDEIIANIRDRLNEEIVSSARGVYGG